MVKFLFFLLIDVIVLLQVNLFAHVKVMERGDRLVDQITINDRNFDSLNQRTIEFYEGDLKHGDVVVEGLLENDDVSVPPKNMFVEITTDGGLTWSKAQGGSTWKWSFRPELGRTYEFSLRVVKEEPNLQTIPNSIMIGDFRLDIDPSTQMENGKLHGFGLLNIPYLERFSHSGKLRVDFNNLQIDETKVLLGEVRSSNPFTITTPTATIAIENMTVSAQTNMGSLNGHVRFKGIFDRLPQMQLSELSKITSSGFELRGVTGAVEIPIWSEQGVVLSLNSGEMKVHYSLGEIAPNIDFSSLNPNLKFGRLLRNASNPSQILQAALSRVSNGMYGIVLPENIYLTDESIALHNGLATFDITTLSAPKIGLQSSIDFRNHPHPILKRMVGGTIDMMIANSELSATVSFGSNLPPMVIFNRGGGEKDVRINITQPPVIEMRLASNGKIDCDLSSLQAELSFGDVLQYGDATLRSAVAHLTFNSEMPSSALFSFLNTPRVYLPGGKFAIEGLNGRLNLDNFSIALSGSAYLDRYEDIFIRALRGNSVNLSIAPDAMNLTMRADGGIAPITLLNRGGAGKDVVVRFEGTPSITLSFGRDDIDFSVGSLNGEVDFGDLLKTAQNSSQTVVAQFKNNLHSALYDITLPAVPLYLLGKPLILSNLSAQFIPSAQTIQMGGNLDLRGYPNPIARHIQSATLNAKIATSGFEATVESLAGAQSVVILDRGGVGKDIKMEFTSPPQIRLALNRDDIDFSLSGGSAQLSFGDLLEHSVAELVSSADGVYSWSLSGRKKVIDDTDLYLSELMGTLDLNDISNPAVDFHANADVSQMGGIFSTLSSSGIENGRIDRNGLKGILSLQRENIDIWRERNVKLHFDQSPKIRLAIVRSGLTVGMESFNGTLEFGDLLDQATAQIQSSIEEGEAIGREAGENVENLLHWNIIGDKKVAGSEIVLKTISGTLNLASLTSPEISISALIDLKNYAPVFANASLIELQQGRISSHGMSASVAMPLSSIDIWKDKNVKIDFLRPSNFKLNVDTQALKLALESVDAEIDFGDLLPMAKGHLSSLEEGKFGWNLNGNYRLDDEDITLQNLIGQIDVHDWSAPKVVFGGKINLASYGSLFNGFEAVNFDNATISSDGLLASIELPLRKIDIWNSKNVHLDFNPERLAKLSLNVTRSGVSAGLSNIDAMLNFGDLLGGIRTQLIPIEGKMDVMGWNIPNMDSPRTLIADTMGSVNVSQLGGELHLKEISNPMVQFDAAGAINGYMGISLPTVSISQAKISRAGIDLNLRVSGEESFTIVEMGGDTHDVRLVVSGSVGGGVNGVSADGNATLYWGDLFPDAPPVALNKTANGYSFALNTPISYRKGVQQIAFSGLRGDLSRDSAGKYVIRSLSGTMGLESTILSKIGLNSIDIGGFSIDSSGFHGVITLSEMNREFSIVNGKANIELRGVSIELNTARDVPITVNGIDASLDLSPTLGSGMKTALGLQDGMLSWNLPAAVTLQEKFTFSGLGGTIGFGDMNVPNIQISGKVNIAGMESLDLTLKDFKVTAAGLRGSVAAPDTNVELGGISGLKLSGMSLSFGETISGNIALNYRNRDFLGSNLNLTMSAVIDERGIGDFKVENLPSVRINNFADLTFLSASFNISSGIKLSGTFKPNNPLLSVNTTMAFDGLRIDKNGIGLDGAGVEKTIQLHGSLGGLELSITKMGMGFLDQKLYVMVGGGLSLEIATAAAEVKLFSDGTIHVNDISINVKNSSLSLVGTAQWYNNDTLYGNGFGISGLDINMINTLSVKGDFKIGNKNGLYWLAKAQGDLPTPVSVIPGALNAYSVGGGIGYRMKYNTAEKKFMPTESNTISVILSTLIGTTDNGFTWHGQFDLMLDSSSQIVLDGDSYILDQLHATPHDKRISATVTLSSSSLHIAGDAQIHYMILNMTGAVDILLSNTKQHVYIGRVESPISITVDHIGLGASGYFMIDNRALRFGAEYGLKKRLEKDWWGPNPWVSINAEAGADGIIYYSPFYIDLEAYASVMLGVGYGSVWDAYLGLSLNLQLHAPDPTYAKVKLGFYIPDPYDGWVHFTTYFPSKPANVSSDTYPPLISGLEPYADTGNSLLSSPSVTTTMNSDGTAFGLDEEGEKLYRLSLENVTFKDINTSQNIAFQSIQKEPAIRSFMPQSLLQPGHSYRLSGNAVLKKNNQSLKTEPFEKVFSTKDELRLDLDEIITKVTPLPNARDVGGDEKVVITYTDNVRILPSQMDHQLVKNFVLKVKDPLEKEIPGTFTRQYATPMKSIFTPATDALRPYHYCRYEATGEVKEAFKNESGEYINPFTVMDEAPSSGSNAKYSVNKGTSSGNSSHGYLESLNRYTCWTKDVFTISIVDTNKSQEVYMSQFAVRYPQTAGEGVRRMEAMGDLVKPVLRLTMIENTLSEISQMRAQGYSSTVLVNSQSSDDEGMENEAAVVSLATATANDLHVGGANSSSLVSLYKNVSMNVDPGLFAIGVRGGVGYRIRTTWSGKNSNGADVSIEQVDDSVGYSEHWRKNKNFAIPVYRLDSASIEYYNIATQGILLARELEIVNGGVIGNSEDFNNERNQQLQNSADQIGRDFGFNGHTGGVSPGGDPMFNSLGGSKNNFGSFQQGGMR